MIYFLETKLETGSYIIYNNKTGIGKYIRPFYHNI